MSLIRQDDPDRYALVETLATRQMARVLATDRTSKRLFIVTASYTEMAPGPDGKAPPPAFHRDSFTALTYARQ